MLFLEPQFQFNNDIQDEKTLNWGSLGLLRFSLQGIKIFDISKKADFPSGFQKPNFRVGPIETASLFPSCNEIKPMSEMLLLQG